ncbi:MAG: aminodeoxychorismate lyase [Gammaproteobacteria bacterium]|nr:MAG: aminodeoxychorismate lyase [Gammaproteobacteria bacterium]
MSAVEGYCLINGHWSDVIPVRDRGFAYGHGVFETIRLYGGRLIMADLHLARLSQGVEQLAISFDPVKLQSYLDQLLSRTPENGVVKVTCTAGEGARGYRTDPESRPNYILQWMPLPDYPLSWAKEGVSAMVCEQRLAHAPRLAGIKHLNRLEQVLGCMEWQDRFQEGLMRDMQGHIIEGTMTNLFGFHDGTWLTPWLKNCGVAGVMRQHLMDKLMPSLGQPVCEAELTLDSLADMEELFLCNSVAGIWPIRELAGVGQWQPGKATVALSRALSKDFACFGA